MTDGPSSSRSQRQLITGTGSVLQKTTKRAVRIQIPFLAAAVAYYALVSTVPLLAVVLVSAATIGGEEFTANILAGAENVLTPETQELLVDALVAGTGRVGATAIGSGIVVWSAFRVFRGLDQAFSRIYRTIGEKSIIAELRDALLVLAGILLAALLMTVASIGLQILPLGPLVGVGGTVLLVITLLVVMFPIYYRYPGVEMKPVEALPGATVAAVGWVLLASLFNIYVAVAGGVALYGPLGAVLLLVTLFYFAALVVMYGAVLNVVAADRQLQHGGQ